MMDTHFGNSLSNRLTVAEVAILRAIDPGLNTRLGATVLQRLEPPVKGLGRLDRASGLTVS